MRRGFILLIVIFVAAGLQLLLHGRGRGEEPNKNPRHVLSESELKTRSINRALDRADSMKTWLKRNGYSTSLVMMADMSLSMDLKRLYIIQPDSHKVLYSCIMAHGKGKGSRIDSVVFSNVVGSLCTSEGRYKLGDSMHGEYGKGYRLHGLEATNNNAYKRLVVFHYYEPQTSEEHSDPLIYSSGCPMLARVDFDVCDKLIRKETKPILLSIYR
jgi:hypothetical protein